MGKLVLILVTVATFIGAFASFGTRQNMASVDDQMADENFEMLARAAALTGHNMAVQRLADDLLKPTPVFDGGTLTGSYNGSDYRCTTTTSGVDKAKVFCKAWSFNADGDSVDFKIRAEYEQHSVPSGINETAPAFMSYAVLSEKDISLQGNILTDVCEICVEGTEGEKLNANMHTNSNMQVTGNSASVMGFGTYGGGGSSNPKKALANTFTPNYNPTGANTTYQAGTISIPILNTSLMALALGPDSVSTGDVVLSSDMDLGGTRDNPFIWHVKGNVTASGNSKMDGYVMFIVDGMVDFSGGIDAGDYDGYEGGDESSVAFYVQGDVEFNGTVEVWGQVFTGGEVLFRGTPDVYGSITADEVDFRGTVGIHYRSASPALTTFWNGQNNLRLKRLAYSEF